jgi:hypothetical protein
MIKILTEQTIIDAKLVNTKYELLKDESTTDFEILVAETAINVAKLCSVKQDTSVDKILSDIGKSDTNK